MIDFGMVRPGTTLYVPFATYDSNDPTASVTMTGLAVTDIEIYKDGGTTQRASDAGYTLLDTDGIDFDSLTGIHGFSIDLADNTTAGFYAAGSQYWIVVSSITVDAGVVSFIAGTFRIGLPDAVLNTTIATLASQTSFTLTAGPAEDSALVGCVCYIHDVASSVQGGFAVISAYTGSSKTVTLAAGPTFTAAAADNIAVYPPANARWFGTTLQTERDIAADTSLIPSIGSGTGAALNFAATTDNTGGAIESVTFVGSQANTYASTAAEDGTRHSITDSGGSPDIDIVYQFAVGAGRNAARVVWKGYVTTGDTVTVQAFNGSTWDTRATIAGSASTTNQTKDIPLLATHTGTGANAGRVLIRFTCTGMTNVVLHTDEMLVAGVSVGMSVGYADGALWVKATGTSGTTPYTHGTADNPAPWASIKTLNATLGLNRYTVTPGTTITLDAALTGSVMTGRSYTLALGGQNISLSYFEGIESLSGTGTTATGEAIFVDCHIGTVSLGEFDFVRCHIHGTITMATASKPYRIHDCTGIENATIEFGAATQTLVLSRMSGAVTITGMTTGDTLLVDGDGVLTLGATCNGGTVHVSGNIELTKSSTGQTITYGATKLGDGMAHGGATASMMLGDTDVETALDLAASPALGAPVPYAPTAAVRVIGDDDGGDYTALASHDDNTMVTGEDGTTGLEVTVTRATSIATENPSLARVSGYYGGPQQHEVYIQAYNFTTSIYDTLAHMHNRSTSFDYVVPLTTNHHDANGQMILRFKHSTGTYNSGDSLRLDWVSFEKVVTTSAIATDIAHIISLIGAPADQTVSRDISNLPTVADLSPAAIEAYFAARHGRGPYTR